MTTFRPLQGHFQVLDKYQISINKTDKNAINTTMQEDMTTVSDKNNKLLFIKFKKKNISIKQ